MKKPGQRAIFAGCLLIAVGVLYIGLSTFGIAFLMVEVQHEIVEHGKVDPDSLSAGAAQSIRRTAFALTVAVPAIVSGCLLVLAGVWHVRKGRRSFHREGAELSGKGIGEANGGRF